MLIINLAEGELMALNRQFIFLLSFIVFAVFIAKNSYANDTPIALKNLNQGCLESLEAFSEITDCFQLYSSMFNDVVLETDNYYLIPEHGKTPEMAFEYLGNGFTDDLAHAIVNTFLEWNPASGTMYIIPCDGIPVLTYSDFEDIQYFMENHDSIIFQRHYYNCYSAGDHYCYQVQGILTSSGWKISELKLDIVL
jgi:hypothetical protein